MRRPVPRGKRRGLIDSRSTLPPLQGPSFDAGAVAQVGLINQFEPRRIAAPAPSRAAFTLPTGMERVSVHARTRLCRRGQNLPGKGLSEPETARHFAPTIRRDQQRRPETRLRLARKPPKIGSFSRDRRKSYLHRTARLDRDARNNQPSAPGRGCSPVPAKTMRANPICAGK